MAVEPGSPTPSVNGVSFNPIKKIVNGTSCPPEHHCNGEGINHGASANSSPRPSSRPSSSASSHTRSYREEPMSNGIRHSKSHRIKSFGIREEDAGGPQSRAHANIRTYADDARVKQFPRISKPVELMRSSYDVVVIGSGYGGAVAASRLARCEDESGNRQSVCVLERGNEKWPGEYPSGVMDSLDEIHVSGEFSPSWFPSQMVQQGDPTGMYHLIFGKGLNTVVCNGKSSRNAPSQTSIR